MTFVLFLYVKVRTLSAAWKSGSFVKADPTALGLTAHLAVYIFSCSDINLFTGLKDLGINGSFAICTLLH